MFPYGQKHKILILWRNPGVNCALQFNIKYDKLYIDYHDNNFSFRFDYLKYVIKVDKIFFKSEFHLNFYKNFFGKKLIEEKENKYEIIMNGLRIDNFTVSSNYDGIREPYRFCYCSAYDRGLFELLQFVWPVIYKNEPRAELHIYYGIDSIRDEQFKMNLIFLMGQPGVMDHGRKSMNDIIIEKYKSSFQLYITDCIGEIDCISIRESLITGCIPLISNSNLFKNRDGIHFDLNKKTPEDYTNIANKIVNIMKKEEFLNLCRNKFKNSNTIISWNDIAKKWI